MTLCPIAAKVGCAKCPIVKMCPGKSIIGNHKPKQPGSGQKGN